MSLYPNFVFIGATSCLMYNIVRADCGPSTPPCHVKYSVLRGSEEAVRRRVLSRPVGLGPLCSMDLGNWTAFPVFPSPHGTQEDHSSSLLGGGLESGRTECETGTLRKEWAQDFAKFPSLQPPQTHWTKCLQTRQLGPFPRSLFLKDSQVTKLTLNVHVVFTC